jgi:hypothetical protein
MYDSLTRSCRLVKYPFTICFIAQRYPPAGAYLGSCKAWLPLPGAGCQAGSLREQAPPQRQYRRTACWGLACQPRGRPAMCGVPGRASSRASSAQGSTVAQCVGAGPAMRGVSVQRGKTMMRVCLHVCYSACTKLPGAFTCSVKPVVSAALVYGAFHASSRALRSRLSA